MKNLSIVFRGAGIFFLVAGIVLEVQRASSADGLIKISLLLFAFSILCRAFSRMRKGKGASLN